MRNNVVYVDFSKKRKAERGHKTAGSFSIIGWIKGLFSSSREKGMPKNTPFICKRIL